MTRPGSYFAIAAPVLALLALRSKLSLTPLDFQLHDAYHVFSPAAVLSGIAVAVAIGWLASFSLILIAQGMFLVNRISGLAKLRTSP